MNNEEIKQQLKNIARMQKMFVIYSEIPSNEAERAERDAKIQKLKRQLEE